MQAYDVTRKRTVNIERMDETGAIIAYSLPGQPGSWFFPQIKDGKNVEPYRIIENEQLSLI